MANQYVSKVVLADGTVLMDLTADTNDAQHTLAGYTGHSADGAPFTGSCPFDSDTSEDTLQIGEALVGETFHARGQAFEGTMPNNGAVAGVITDIDNPYVIPQGYHDGSGTVNVSAADLAKLRDHSNIKNGVTILGETGTYSGEAATVQTKNATPKLAAQTILPDSGFDYLSQVNIAAITIAYADNAAGGRTCTIGAV